MRLTKYLRSAFIVLIVAAVSVAGCAGATEDKGAVDTDSQPALATGQSAPGGQAAPAANDDGTGERTEGDQQPSGVTVFIDGSEAPAGVIVMREAPAASMEWLEEALGWEAAFAADTGEGSLTGADRVLEFQLDERFFWVNGHRNSWSTLLPELHDGAVYIDLSLAAAQMGYRVNWDATAQTLTLERVPENDIVIRTETIEADGPHIGVAVQYPQLAGLADAEAEARINAILAEHGAMTLARAEHFEEEYDDPRGMRYLFDLSYEITYNENGVISVLFHDYMFTGGAHGGTTRYSHTFDLATGHEYSLGDLLGYRPDWLAEASAEIARQFEKRDIYMLNEFHGIEPDQPFYVKDGHAIVYFQQYEYTPYAYGFPEFELPWELQFRAP